MERIRKPFQGVYNIIRFNRHFYFLSLGVILLLLLLKSYTNSTLQLLINIILMLLIFLIFFSLLTSFYIYDVSDLYTLSWLKNVQEKAAIQVLNIHAGFDETSELLQQKYQHATLTVFDFYNPLMHTEISIKRARKAYPAYPNTQLINTAALPLPDDTMDRIFLFLAAHEIRNEQERIMFFKELHRILQPAGQIVVTEHLRDKANFLAYNIGFFHFYSKKAWLKTFAAAALYVKEEIKITPFITSFILAKNGSTY